MTNDHLPTNDSGESVIYQLRVKGHLGAQWGAWFGGMSVIPGENGETILVGQIADQAALYGVLRKVRDLGLPLVGVSPIKPSSADTSDAEGQHDASS
ncbi:MAG: hypothetical protein H0T53_03420 [Herpetosiphonaceae bacterium]|nr:hypothetical protein [Herpetosiphonaceae bacterium]